MRFSRRLCAFVAWALLSAPLLAGSLDGIWLAKYQDSQGRSREMWFQFATVKEKLTGKVRIGPAADLYIQNGKVERNRVSFEVLFQYDEGYRPDTMIFTGKLEGDTLRLTRTTKGKGGAQNLVAQRTAEKL